MLAASSESVWFIENPYLRGHETPAHYQLNRTKPNKKGGYKAAFSLGLKVCLVIGPGIDRALGQVDQHGEDQHKDRGLLEPYAA